MRPKNCSVSKSCFTNYIYPMTIFKKTLIACSFLLFSMAAHAQDGLEAGGWLGISNYFGDLNTNMRLNRINPAGGVGFRYNFNERVAVKLSGNIGTVEAYDSDSDNIYERARNLHFKSQVADAGLQLGFNFLPYVHGSADENWTPYLFLGLGVSYFNPKAELDGRMA